MDRKFNLRITQIPFFRPDVYTFDKEHKHYVLNVLAHRRAGKSKGESWSVRNDVDKFLSEDEIYNIRADVDSDNPLIVYSAPTKLQARQIIWKYFQQDLAGIPGVKFNNTRLSVTIPRPKTKDEIEVYLMASKNHDRARGLKIRKLYNDEAQDSPENAVASSFRPALKDTNGYLVQTGTAKGCDHFYTSLCHYHDIGAHMFMYPITMTGVFTDKEIWNIKQECIGGEFEREYMLDFFAALEGVFYHNLFVQLEKETDFFTAVKEPSASNILGVDIGIGKGFAAWAVQQRYDDRKLHVQDYYSDYDNLDALKNDLEDDDNMPDVIILPHDGNTRVMQVAESKTNKDMFKEVFPRTQIRTVKRCSPREKMKEIDRVGRHLHLLRFPEKEMPSDAHIGRRNLKEFGRKKNPTTGVFMDQVDKSRGVDHAADAMATLMVGLGVKDGDFTRKFTYKVGNEQAKVSAKSKNLLLAGRGSVYKALHPPEEPQFISPTSVQRAH